MSRDMAASRGTVSPRKATNMTSVIRAIAISEATVES
jgi:hypothetical protein